MLSIVIPFYKDYPYLRQAVQSVLAQGFPRYEIVIVNDNPSPEAHRFLASQTFPDTVTIVHHEANRGLSAARNTGLANCSGEYVVYLDADDYFIPGGLREQFRRARASKADVTHSTTYLRSDRGVGSLTLNLISRDKQMFEVDVDATTVDQTPDIQFIISSWKSIYRRDFLEVAQIRFDEAQRKFEDRLYVLETVFSGARFTLVSAPSRIWRRRPGSITTSLKSDTDLRMMAALIDKCTGLMERKVAAGYDPIFLKREVFHSTARLIWDTPLLAKAAETDQTALHIREVLQRSLARTRLEPDIFRDPVVRKIDRVGLKNPAGEQFTQNDFLKLWKGVADGNWDAVAKPKTVVEVEKAQDAVSATEPERGRPIKKPAKGGPFNDVELMIHIGQHKTGTTHLQREFHRHRDEMIARGVLFPNTGFVEDMDTASKAEATPGHQGILRAIIDNDKSVLKALKGEIEQSGCRKVLISCENLSFPYQEPIERRRRVRLANAFFSEFPNRRVISVIRRPDEYIESLYRERVGNAIVRETRSASEYVSSFGGNLLNLERMFAPWQEFADDNLLLLDYGLLKAGPDYAHAFGKALDLGVEDLFPNERKSRRQTYASAGWDEVELIRLLNMMIPDEDWRRASAQSFVNTCAAMGRATRQSLLSPDERLGIVQDMREFSENFLEGHGLKLDFDGITTELEAELDSWSPPEAIDFDKLEALFNALTGTRHLAPQSLQGGRIQWLLSNPKVRGTLLNVYARLPIAAQRAARWAYGRIG